MLAPVRSPLLRQGASRTYTTPRVHLRALSFASVRQESPFAEGSHVTLNDGAVMPNSAFHVGPDLPEGKVEGVVYNAVQAGFGHLS